MRRKVGILIGIVILFIIVYKTITVQFYDKEFERAVRECISWHDLSSSNEREAVYRGWIFRSDINKIGTIYVNINKYKIKDLRDLKYFKNLRELHLSYVPEENQARTADMPAHIDSIFALRHLNRLTFFRLNINESYSQIHKGVTTLMIDKSKRTDYSFIKSFPDLEFLSLADSNIDSLEFIEDLQKLSTLQLGYNDYSCSLEPLTQAGNLTELLVFSDTPKVFEQLPPIPSVKELHLVGKAAPSRVQAERYMKWDNLEELWLGGDMYDVAAGTWSTEN